MSGLKVRGWNGSQQKDLLLYLDVSTNEGTEESWERTEMDKHRAFGSHSLTQRSKDWLQRDVLFGWPPEVEH